jgi:hypothetical protein
MLAVMFKINVNVKIDEDSIRRKITEAAKQKIRAKVAGLPNVKVTFDCDSKGFPTKVHLSGPDEEVAKAAKLLKSK